MPHPQDPRAGIAQFLCLQAALVLLWWYLLAHVPSSLRWFLPEDVPAETLRYLAPADLLLLGFGALPVAGVIARRHAAGPALAWAYGGAVLYPTVICVAASFRTDQAWPAAACMGLMSLATWSAISMLGLPGQEAACFRPAPMGPQRARRFTFLQIAVFWFVFLVLVPLGAREAMAHLGYSAFYHGGQRFVSSLLLLAGSGLGLASAWTLSSHGQGTPLPTATAATLVARGPFAWVRNPMALAGTLQMIAVGWGLGTWPVVILALLGSGVWHFWVRPLEEADLQHRFGASYSDYRSRTPLWIPRPPRS
ncbi:MAG: isoprenylcysteine carboxylmethyltransferase family protein [Planctomycetota bacterium]